MPSYCVIINDSDLIILYFSVVKRILTSNDLVKQELLTIPRVVQMSVKSVFAADDIGE